MSLKKLHPEQEIHIPPEVRDVFSDPRFDPEYLIGVLISAPNSKVRAALRHIVSTPDGLAWLFKNDCLQAVTELQATLGAPELLHRLIDDDRFTVLTDPEDPTRHVYLLYGEDGVARGASPRGIRITIIGDDESVTAITNLTHASVDDSSLPF